MRGSRGREQRPRKGVSRGLGLVLTLVGTCPALGETCGPQTSFPTTEKWEGPRRQGPPTACASERRQPEWGSGGWPRSFPAWCGFWLRRTLARPPLFKQCSRLAGLPLTSGKHTHENQAKQHRRYFLSQWSAVGEELAWLRLTRDLWSGVRCLVDVNRQ